MAVGGLAGVCTGTPYDLGILRTYHMPADMGGLGWAGLGCTCIVSYVTAVLAACVLIYCCLCKKKAEQGGGEPQNQKFHRVHDRSHHDDHHDDRHDDHDHDDRRRRRRRHDDDDDYDQP